MTTYLFPTTDVLRLKQELESLRKEFTGGHGRIAAGGVVGRALKYIEYLETRLHDLTAWEHR